LEASEIHAHIYGQLVFNKDENIKDHHFKNHTREFGGINENDGVGNSRHLILYRDRTVKYELSEPMFYKFGKQTKIYDNQENVESRKTP
jgi:hypothetical protein